MLFQLSGVATVINVNKIKDDFTKIQVIGSHRRKSINGTQDTSGARWITLNGKAANWWADNSEKVKGSVINIVATASTDMHSDKFYENYRASDLSITTWPEHAKHVKSTLLTLSGVGRVIGITKISDDFAKLKVISSEKFKEKEVTSTRYISISGKTASWWIDNEFRALKSLIHFKCEVLTDTREINGVTRYFDNYRSIERPNIVQFPQGFNQPVVEQPVVEQPAKSSNDIDGFNQDYPDYLNQEIPNFDDIPSPEEYERYMQQTVV